MPKLYELVAAEPELRSAAEKIFTETTKIFANKDALFNGLNRHYVKMFEDEVELPAEDKPLTTTVVKRLAFTFKYLSKAMWSFIVKEVTNTTAKADIFIDDKMIAQGLPAVVLIYLEKQFKGLRTLLDNTPTLDPVENWKWNDSVGHYVADERVSFKTKKVMINHVKTEATKEHPAQVEVYSDDKAIGRWFTKKSCGMLSPAEKSEMLERADQLIMAIIQARQRANDVAIVTTHKTVADDLLNYVLDGAKIGRQA